MDRDTQSNMDRRSYNRQKGERAPLYERFWAKVDVRREDECWPWLAGTVGGYGTIGEGGSHGRVVKAHRVAYEIANGPIPEGLLIMHTCDSPPCCNAKHLVAGTVAQNNKDRDDKKRFVKVYMQGSKNGHAKLDEAKVREIRHRLATTRITQTALAKEYKVDTSLISDIYRFKIWTHVPRRILRTRYGA